MGQGKFFVIEGVDGSGKTTQLNLLKEKFATLGADAWFTAEPTERPIGLMIRSVLEKRLAVSPATLAGLFLADRLDHLENKENGMLQQLAAGTHIVSDRYYWSSYAYHSLDVDMDWVIELNRACSRLLRPTITFYLDLPVSESMNRIASRKGEAELFEKKELITQVRENYLTSMEKLKEEERIIRIDATRSPEEMFENIWGHIQLELDPIA